MVLEKPIVPYLEWLSSAVVPFCLGLLVVIAVGLVLGFLSNALRQGPILAIRSVVGLIITSIKEAFQSSPRRLFAIARLAFQESIRRRVLVVFAIFVIALLFGGWFLDRDSDHPARLYLSFVLTSTNYLVLLLAIFISAFSIPNDMKYKTIFTVVTKPVRGWEIVLGRMLGFITIGTVLLALMCVFSYFFVTRGLQHDHAIDPEALVSVPSQVDSPQVLGKTELARRHRHDVILHPDGTLSTSPEKEHVHTITERDGVYRVGKARGQLTARVPIRGKLRFLDDAGQPSEGTNVGYEWAYRRYIEGGTLAAAIWRFDGLEPDDFGDTIPLEMSIRVFRTYKGNIEKGLRGTIELVKPAKLDEEGRPVALDGGWRSTEISFVAQEYTAYQPRIPRRLKVRDDEGNEREVDVFEELVDPETGALEVWIRCLDNAQYLGMAPADLYLRAKDQPFWLNFVKGYVSIWMQMVVVTCLGVTFSTFLSGPVAMISTLAALIMGMFKQFVVDVATGEIEGGGPIESLVRIVKQWNQMSEFEDSIGTEIIQRIDAVLMLFVQGISYAMPDCSIFNTSSFVAYGFNIPPSLMAQHMTTMLAYTVVTSIAAYFFFKSREIAA